jgi:hypothetical protein
MLLKDIQKLSLVLYILHLSVATVENQQIAPRKILLFAFYKVYNITDIYVHRNYNSA